MKVIKKNQLAILVISLMLITAGYLNYGTNYSSGTGMEASAGIEEKEALDLAALGDAELVNADNVDENKENTTSNVNEESKNDANNQSTSQVPTTTTSSNYSDDYFVKSKLERNVMYSQMIERYQGIINSNTQAVEQKTIAQQEINKINELQNAIMIAENLLTSKGFDKNIIFVNGDSISAIIGKEDIKPDEIAQIQNIISRELSAEVDNIHISMK